MNTKLPFFYSVYAGACGVCFRKRKTQVRKYKFGSNIQTINNTNNITKITNLDPDHRGLFFALRAEAGGMLKAFRTVEHTTGKTAFFTASANVAVLREQECI